MDLHRPKTRARWRRIWAIGLSLLLVQAALLGLGALYQSMASADDLRRFPPPGRLIDVGGYRLHLYCIGEHVPEKPTVIFEGGLGAPGLMWSLVQPEVAAQTRACSYDRAGYGWSDPAPADVPRTAQQMVSELHRLLEQAGESPPYLLVGHSLGGILIRVYAANYASDVSGLIFVDARHEDFFERMPPDYLQIDEANLRRAQWLRLVTPFGLTRLAGAVGILDTFETYLAPLPDDIEQAAWARMIYNSQHWATSVAEREAILESYKQVRETRLPDSLPILVLTAENGLEAWRSTSTSLDDSVRVTWLEMQQELAQLTSQGEWVIVKDSGHYIYLDRPEAVIEAVSTMLEK